MDANGAATAVLWYFAFVVSTTAHEASHALVAYLGGDPTAYRAGQVSLNPLPHMRREPVGMLLVPLFSVFTQGWCIGWASTPYDPRWEQRYPRRAAWMAAAGPGANLAIAAVALVLLRVGLATGLFYAPERVSLSRMVASDLSFADSAGALLSILLVLNVILFLFNLIPLPPLDGASAFGLLLSERNALRWRQLLRSGPVALGLLVAWLLFGRAVEPVFALLLSLVHPGHSYG